jgi:hypothetical protein
MFSRCQYLPIMRDVLKTLMSTDQSRCPQISTDQARCPQDAYIYRSGAMSSRRLYLLIRRSRSTVLLKFWIKTQVKDLKTLWKLRNLSLSLRIGHDDLNVGWSPDWLKLSSSCVRTEQEEVGKELWGWVLDIRWFWRTRRGLYLCLCLSLSTDFGTSFLQATTKNSCSATCAVEQWIWRSRRNVYISWRSGSLNCNFLVTPLFCTFL